MAGYTGRGGRGWGALIGLALVAMVLWAGGNPLALVGFPLALVLLALPPRRMPQLALALVAFGIAALGFSGDALWILDGTWAGLLAVWFVVALYVLPRSTLTMRALAATGASALTATVLAIFRPDVPRVLDATIAAQLKGMAAETVASWKAAGAQVPPALVDGLNRMVALRSFLAPAFAGVASLAALAVAWWVYRRTVAVEERPLAPVRDFRFRDELIWLVIAGIVLVLIPGLGAWALRAGSNLLTFMGALYALRGLAVLVALAGGGLSAGGVVLAMLVALVVPPVVMAATILLGLTDTWLDLRARIARPGGPGNDGVIR